MTYLCATPLCNAIEAFTLCCDHPVCLHKNCHARKSSCDTVWLQASLRQPEMSAQGAPKLRGAKSRDSYRRIASESFLDLRLRIASFRCRSYLPGIFPEITPGKPCVRGLCRDSKLFLFLGLLAAPTRNSSRKLSAFTESLATFPEKKVAKPPGLETA